MSGLPRSVRLTRLRELFEARKSGYSSEELASLTGVTTRSIQRDLLTLQTDMHVPLMHDGVRYRLMPSDRLPALNLTLQQARAVLVATRLFLRYSDQGDPDASGALEALAGVLPEPVRAQVQQAARSIDRRPFDPAFTRTMTTVTDAWAHRRVLRLSYRSAGKQRPREVIVHPYFIEPSAAGFATYLIGYSETHAMMRTFKIERIVSAEKLPRAFELDGAADVEQLLSTAWGIIWGEGVQVRLRFPADVAYRVRESHWHPSQSVEELADGGLVLTMTVASMLELGRWVRGWGDKVEVLSPASLREELRAESLRLARLYSVKAKSPRRVRKRVDTDAVAVEQQASLPA